ncbi:hypothetical protein CDD80_1282 [Ophiocordyceps camponoti-rufipedis]|uniref:Uncharacterized protein n=1 Tax=Ophiocordyceps camponoti-rufipedis TaxID=2004952 RepID=A0A2C5ZF00_9HYPO|nr:hypothetical protein CDD80_1282 [Ophiocordyceps camponoti-rufipedis]
MRTKNLLFASLGLAAAMLPHAYAQREPEDEANLNGIDKDLESIKSLFADPCQPDGDIKLGGDELQPPCSVQPVIETVCEQNVGVIKLEGNAMPKGNQSTYNTCLIGNGSSFKQDVEACINCRELANVYSKEQATQQREVTTVAFETLEKSANKTGPEIKTFSEIVEEELEANRPLQRAPDVNTDNTPPKITDYYKNPPKSQNIGDFQQLLEKGGKEEDAGGENGSPSASPSPASPSATNKAEDGEEADKAKGAPKKRSLTRRKVQRRDQVQSMEQANFTCVRPPPRGGRRRRAIVPVSQKPVNPPLRPAARGAVLPTNPVNNKDQQQGQMEERDFFMACLMVMHCKGQKLCTLATMCAKKPVPIQDSKATPLKTITPQQQQNNATLPVLSNCPACEQKPMPVEKVERPKIDPVTKKGDKTSELAIQKVDNNGVQGLKIELIFANVFLFGQPQSCNDCLNGGAPVQLGGSQDSQPVASGGQQGPQVAQPVAPQPNGQQPKKQEPNEQPPQPNAPQSQATPPKNPCK